MEAMFRDIDGYRPYAIDEFECSGEDLFVDAEDYKAVTEEKYLDVEEDSDIIDDKIKKSVSSLVKNWVLEDLGEDSFCVVDMAILDKTNVSKITSDYVVSKKLDGERKLCVGRENKTYLCSRGYAREEVLLDDTVEGYILDVEQIGDNIIVLDVLSTPKGVVRWMPLARRMSSLPKFSVNSRWFVQQYRFVKDIDYIATVHSRFKDDGFVFQCGYSPYYFGYNPSMYKWKPRGDTVDLMCRFNGDNKPYSFCAERQDGLVSVRDVKEGREKYKIGFVYECFFSTKPEVFRVIRPRPDKMVANSHATVARVLVANRYCISRMALIRRCRKIEPATTSYYVELNYISNKIISRCKARFGGKFAVNEEGDEKEIAEAKHDHSDVDDFLDDRLEKIRSLGYDPSDDEEKHDGDEEKDNIEDKTEETSHEEVSSLNFG